MEENKINRWLTLGANFGVLIGLALLVFEIRQSTIAVQTSSLQQHADHHLALVLARLDKPELLASIRDARNGLSGLSPDDQYYHPYTGNLFRSHFLAFELMNSGIMPKLQWRSFRTSLKSVLRGSKGAQELWKFRLEMAPDDYSQEFIDFVNAYIAELEQS